MELDTLRRRTEWHRVANERRYEAPADPWRLVHVDPTRVDRWNNEVRLNWGVGRVQGGDWDADEHCHPIAETAGYRGLVQRFSEGRDWEETALYERAKSQFEDGRSPRGYEDIDTYRDERCAYLDDLYERIEREGYRPNRDATHDNPAAADNRYEDAYVHHLEPLVVVGRDGEIYWTEGFHRLGIARILGLDSISVQVLCRHVEWQQVRDELATTSQDDRPESLDGYTGHPDLADIGPGE